MCKGDIPLSMLSREVDNTYIYGFTQRLTNRDNTIVAAKWLSHPLGNLPIF